jgi:hypothetical protein
MHPESSREQLITGFRKALSGLENEKIKGWVEFETTNKNRGALAALIFYGACVRESMARGIDDPMQAHLIAVVTLSLFEENDFDSVMYYMIGKPLPSRTIEFIEHYKTRLQADVTEGINSMNETISNLSNVSFDVSDFDEDDEINFEDDDNN